MEKMSVLKPVSKQPRLMNQSQVTRTESVGILPVDTPALQGKDLPTGTHPLAQGETMRKETPKHPKGHKVVNIEDVWKTMDTQSFLHLSDTAALNDVWVQPVRVEPTTSQYANIEFVQIVAAPHIKYRRTTCKLGVDDLFKILYLNDCLACDLRGEVRIGYDEWIAEKTACFIKKHGVEDSTNRSKVGEFILNEDPNFSFYIASGAAMLGVFFRKICYHSYKTKEGCPKFDNPSMVKCCATRGKFEYMLEARIFSLPKDFSCESEEEVPESQPF